MADILNLNRARKARAKATAKATADANRIGFGRTKVEKEMARKATDRQRAMLDGTKRE